MGGADDSDSDDSGYIPWPEWSDGDSSSFPDVSEANTPGGFSHCSTTRLNSFLSKLSREILPTLIATDYDFGDYEPDLTAVFQDLPDGYGAFEQQRRQSVVKSRKRGKSGLARPSKKARIDDDEEEEDEEVVVLKSRKSGGDLETDELEAEPPVSDARRKSDGNIVSVASSSSGASHRSGIMNRTRPRPGAYKPYQESDVLQQQQQQQQPRSQPASNSSEVRTAPKKKPSVDDIPLAARMALRQSQGEMSEVDERVEILKRAAQEQKELDAAAVVAALQEQEKAMLELEDDLMSDDDEDVPLSERLKSMADRQLQRSSGESEAVQMEDVEEVVLDEQVVLPMELAPVGSTDVEMAAQSDVLNEEIQMRGTSATASSEPGQSAEGKLPTTLTSSSSQSAPSPASSPFHSASTPPADILKTIIRATKDSSSAGTTATTTVGGESTSTTKPGSTLPPSTETAKKLAKARQEQQQHAGRQLSNFSTNIGAVEKEIPGLFSGLSRVGSSSSVPQASSAASSGTGSQPAAEKARAAPTGVGTTSQTSSKTVMTATTSQGAHASSAGRSVSQKQHQQEERLTAPSSSTTTTTISVAAAVPSSSSTSISSNQIPATTSRLGFGFPSLGLKPPQAAMSGMETAPTVSSQTMLARQGVATTRAPPTTVKSTVTAVPAHHPMRHPQQQLKKTVAAGVTSASLPAGTTTGTVVGSTVAPAPVQVSSAVSTTTTDVVTTGPLVPSQHQQQHPHQQQHRSQHPQSQEVRQDWEKLKAALENGHLSNYHKAHLLAQMQRKQDPQEERRELEKLKQNLDTENERRTAYIQQQQMMAQKPQMHKANEIQTLLLQQQALHQQQLQMRQPTSHTQQTHPLPLQNVPKSTSFPPSTKHAAAAVPPRPAPTTTTIPASVPTPVSAPAPKVARAPKPTPAPAPRPPQAPVPFGPKPSKKGKARQAHAIRPAPPRYRPGEIVWVQCYLDITREHRRSLPLQNPVMGRPVYVDISPLSKMPYWPAIVERVQPYPASELWTAPLFIEEIAPMKPNLSQTQPQHHQRNHSQDYIVDVKTAQCLADVADGATTLWCYTVRLMKLKNTPSIRLPEQSLHPHVWYECPSESWVYLEELGEGVGGTALTVNHGSAANGSANGGLDAQKLENSIASITTCGIVKAFLSAYGEVAGKCDQVLVLGEGKDVVLGKSFAGFSGFVGRSLGRMVGKVYSELMFGPELLKCQDILRVSLKGVGSGSSQPKGKSRDRCLLVKLLYIYSPSDNTSSNTQNGTRQKREIILWGHTCSSSAASNLNSSSTSTASSSQANIGSSSGVGSRPTEIDVMVPLGEASLQFSLEDVLGRYYPSLCGKNERESQGNGTGPWAEGYEGLKRVMRGMGGWQVKFVEG
ncbi:hypothetical protein HK102_010250 [Quaeritorhiza haematococci]|nr:hypothetical protein HK102_010250 [Quaeritorhiza haematococci]